MLWILFYPQSQKLEPIIGKTTLVSFRFLPDFTSTPLLKNTAVNLKNQLIEIRFYGETRIVINQRLKY